MLIYNMALPFKEDMGAEETGIAKESDCNRKSPYGNFVSTFDFNAVVPPPE
jgi:hypothetical protein